MRLQPGWKAWGLAGRPTTALAVGPGQHPPKNLEEFLNLLSKNLEQRMLEMSPEEQEAANRELEYLGKGIIPNFPVRELIWEEAMKQAWTLVENAMAADSPLILWLQGVREDLEEGDLMDPKEAELELAEPVAEWLHMALENMG